MPALNRIGQRKGIPAQQVDVVEYQGREAGKVLRLYRETLGSKLVKGCLDVERAPEHANVDHQPEYTELSLLPFPIALT
ncbi:MAG TPA: hypothetical protein VGI47_08350 [Candidatus Binataceae bacterium]